jgi:hypothetical protein
MSSYVTEVVNSSVVRSLLPAIMHIMCTAKYDEMLKSLHLCDPLTSFNCVHKQQLIMLTAWVVTLNEEIKFRFQGQWRGPDRSCQVIEYSMRNIWKEKVSGIWLHSFQEDTPLGSDGNTRVKEYIVKVLRENYERQQGFPGWKYLPNVATQRLFYPLNEYDDV